MKKETFDIAIEGTTLKELFLYNGELRTVVIDKSQNYGTTYTDLELLKKSPYISSFEINFFTPDIEKKKLIFTVESLPFLLTYGSHSVRNYSYKIMGGHVEYIKVSDIFFISDNLSRFPTSKNEIFKMNISDKDKFYLYKALRNHDLSILKKSSLDKTNPIYKALVELEIFDNFELMKIAKFFGDNIFIYPVYGISELSESACFRNSFSGVTYILNDSLKHLESNNDGPYRHVFKCNLGTIYCKEFIQQTLIEKHFYVRVILCNKIKYNGNFLIFIELNRDQFVIDTDRNIENHDKFIKIIGLDSSSCVCNEGLQLLYFIKKYSKVSDKELELMSIFKKDILIDLSFITKYDIHQFN